MCPGRNSSFGLGHNLFQNQSCLGFVITFGGFQALVQSFGNNCRNNVLYRGSSKNLLGLTLKLRLGQSHSNYSCKACKDIFFFDLVASQFELSRIRVNLGTNCLYGTLFKTCNVGSALGCGYHVHERAEVGLVASSPPEGNVNLTISSDFGGDHVAFFI